MYTPVAFLPVSDQIWSQHLSTAADAPAHQRLCLHLKSSWHLDLMALGSQLRLQQDLGFLLWQALDHLSQTLLHLHPVLYLWVWLATLFVEARQLQTSHSMLL